MGQVTPFGAVFGPANIPSPMESYDYFQRKKKEDAILGIQNKQLQAKARQEADENFSKAIKPLNDFKANTGFTDVTPDAILTEGSKQIEAKASEMYRSGKSVAEVSQFINNNIKDLNLRQNWFKNAKENAEKEIADLGKDSGIDPGRLRQLVEAELIQGDPKQNPAGVVMRVLQKYPDAIHINNQEALYNVPREGEYKQDYGVIKTADGRKVYGSAVTKYNKLYQEVIVTPDKEVKVQTRAVPLESNGEPITGSGGKPIMVLPEEAYMDFISKPGRMVELEKLTKKMMADKTADAEREAIKRADDMVNARYGMDLKKMPYNKRQSIYQAERKKELASVEVPDDEVIRQQAAYKLADTKIQKPDVKVDQIRDPNKVTISVSGGGSKTDKTVTYKDAFGSIYDNLPDNGSATLIEYPDASAAIVKWLNENGFSKLGKDSISGLDKEVGLDAGDITMTKTGGKLYAQFFGKKIEVSKYLLNRKVNPGNAATVRAITKDSENKNTSTPAVKPDDLRNKYGY